jgi:hypothetical protein
MIQAASIDIEPQRTFEWRKEKEVIAQQIRDLINSYIKEMEDQGNKKNLSTIAGEFDLTDRSLRSIMNEGKIPQLKTMLKIYKVITKEDSTIDLIDRIPSPTRDWILQSKLYESLKNNIENHNSLNLEYEKNKILALIYDLSVDSGISETEIYKNFGTYGLKQLQKLISGDILQKKKDFIIRTKNRIMRTDLAEKNRLMNLCEQFIEPSDFKTLDSNILRVTCYDLTPEQYKNWLYEIEKCFNKLNEIGDSFSQEERSIKASCGMFANKMLERGQNEIH